MEPEILFYDGHCGLCHGTVRFCLKRDRDGQAFRYAPLQGETFAAKVPPDLRPSLPDSVVILTEGGCLLTRSRAVVHILNRLGGFWRAAGALLSVVPRPLRDAGYNFVARIRYKLFRPPESTCPLMPPHLRMRFLP